MRIAVLLALLIVAGGATGALAQDPDVSPAVREAVARIADGGDREGGLRALEALADGGDMGAHDLLGELYTGLAGVPRDQSRSCEHFRVARESAPSAAHNYGQCLWEGAFGTPDFVEARVWYGRAADGGFLQAKCALGNMLIKGQGGAVEAERGLALCREAAEAGEPNAQADMGDYYGDGQVVAQDFAQARQWYERAAARHQRNAAFQLGAMAWNGLGGPADLVAASVWLQQAYADGRKDAAGLAGRSALLRAVPNAPRGPVDVALLAEAKHWFGIAAAEDPSADKRARAAATLAQISGYEDMARQGAIDR